MFISQGRNIKAALTASSVYYNGVKSAVVKKVEGKLFVGPGKSKFYFVTLLSSY